VDDGSSLFEHSRIDDSVFGHDGKWTVAACWRCNCQGVPVDTTVVEFETSWVPLLSAFVAVGGVVFTQYRADRRAVHERREIRDQERARWVREDAAKTYEQRRD
jgi:hypothetical protein